MGEGGRDAPLTMICTHALSSDRSCELTARMSSRNKASGVTFPINSDGVEEGG